MGTFVEPASELASVNGRMGKERVCQHCGKAFQRNGRSCNDGAGPKYCSRACSGLARQRRVEFRCKDCGRVELRVPCEARHERCGACAVVHRTAGMRTRPLMHRLGPVALERWLSLQRAPERLERLRKLMTGRAMVTEKTRRGSARHCRALHFTVKSPAGVTYRVDNLCEFVRTHPELFLPEDTENLLRDRGGYSSRATRGLAKLQTVVATRLSWKGWALTFGCRDELARQALSVEEARAAALGQQEVRPYANN